MFEGATRFRQVRDYEIIRLLLININDDKLDEIVNKSCRYNLFSYYYLGQMMFCLRNANETKVLFMKHRGVRDVCNQMYTRTRPIHTTHTHIQNTHHTHLLCACALCIKLQCKSKVNCIQQTSER